MNREERTIKCHEAAPFVSVLNDGEYVPADFADHIEACPNCRASLRSYSEIGAELRLLASRGREATVVPEALLDKLHSERRPSIWAFWRGRMLVPRFAVITAAAAFVAVSAGLMLCRRRASRGRAGFSSRWSRRNNKRHLDNPALITSPKPVMTREWL